VLDLKELFEENKRLEAGEFWGHVARLRQVRVATPDPIQPVILFGDYIVDPKAGELRKHGIRIKLQVQPFQVLQALLEHPGQVITREELQKRIWPSDTFVDFDHGLNNAVKKLRAALGEDAENPRYIETLAKRGYRFIGAVENSSATTAPEIARDSIVVLPFLSLSGDPENEFFADGITEEIINALAQIKGLHVVARSSAFSFKGKTVDLRVVGERLNARTVLEGSVRKAENRLRITAQLINAADGYHFWSERYDREMKDIFDVQDEIARSIAERLKVTLKTSGQGPLFKAGTKNLVAYEAFLKGRALLYQRGAGIPRALECFQMAVSLDPEYSLAWANIADAYVMLAFYGFVTPDRVLEKAKENAIQAVALDPTVAEGHNALAAAILLRDWDWTKAESEFVRALELDPRSVLARSRYALWCVLVAGGRFEEGVAQAQKASEFDPLSSYAATILAFAYYVAGEAAKALESARHAVQLEPESVLARVSFAFALYLLGRYTEAVSAIEMGLGMSGRHPMFMAALAVTLADGGKLQEAKQVDTELQARAAREFVSPFLLALSSSAVGDRVGAERFLQTAFQIHDPQLTTFGKYWPGSKHLREACGFDEILGKMGLK
jgi:TolB-like protein/Tfp pilus assembly protein PilF